MIKHIVMWKLLENIEGKNKQESVQAIKEKLMSMDGVVPELKSIEVGINQKESDFAYDVVLYTEFDGWDDSVADVRSYDELPENVKKYLARISEFTDTKISIVGVGPKRDQTMRIDNI